MLQINSHNQILIDGQQTGLSVKQTTQGTVVKHHYHSDVFTVPMPCKRYSLSHAQASNGVPGLSQFENDILSYVWELSH
jgi:hypothetical protein